MRKLERVINGNIISLLEIVVYDESDLAELRLYREEKNFILGMDMLPHLNYFSKADYIILTGGELGPEKYEPLYRINPRALVLDYENTSPDDDKIDLERCEGLEYLFSRAQLNCFDYSSCSSLRTLVVFQWYDKDLHELFNSQIDSLEIIKGKLLTLEQINQMQRLKVLYLSNLRKLTDLSAIKDCQSLRKLVINNCGKAQLYKFLESKTLNYLMISGSNRISGLNDLRNLPNLKYILLDGCIIEDGNLECLKNIQHATLFQNRKHYSLDDSKLPKGEMPYMLVKIPSWRQFKP